MSAKVYLAGAGPGDPGLLTCRALKIIGEADVILYDHLVSEGVRALFPEEAERIFGYKVVDGTAIAKAYAIKAP